MCWQVWVCTQFRLDLLNHTDWLWQFGILRCLVVAGQRHILQQRLLGLLQPILCQQQFWPVQQFVLLPDLRHIVLELLLETQVAQSQ